MLVIEWRSHYKFKKNILYEDTALPRSSQSMLRVIHNLNRGPFQILFHQPLAPPDGLGQHLVLNKLLKVLEP
jgi:hypothetical protein